jgi:integrase
MSRRIVVSAGNTEPEIRQRGYVYQKGRKKTDPWVPTQRAYGFYRVDVPGQSRQQEIRKALGFCRDRMSAMLKLHEVMQEAGVLDVEKLRERISPATTFEAQAAWWLAEIKAGRIVNKKTRKAIRPRTIDCYSTAVCYLDGVVGDKPLASLDNPEAKELVARMKAERASGEPRFSDKTICEYFKVFTQVIASAKDDKAKQLYSRPWDLVYICLPMVSEREQHRPTLEPEEVEVILSKCKRFTYRVVAVLLAGTGIRISELLALEIRRHISADCTVISIRQQRGKWGGIEPTPKTEAGFREIDLCPLLAEMLRTYIGDRKSGFLFETESGKMLSPDNLWRDGFATIVRDMGREGVRFHAFRRFREAVLQASECRELLIDFWMGHSNKGMGSRYAKQLVENRKFRAEWAEKAGLGFEIPRAVISEPGLIALPALQNQESVVAAQYRMSV